MKLKSKLLLLFLISLQSIIIPVASNNYESFITGLAKAFESTENVFNKHFNSDWASGHSQDAAKSIDSFRTLEPILTNIGKIIKGTEVHCVQKNQIKAFWINTIKKADKRRGSFLQRTEAEKVNKLKSKTKWGVFSTIEKNVNVNYKAYIAMITSPVLIEFIKILRKIQSDASSDYKVKGRIDLFIKAVSYITTNINGWVDFFVNFICDVNNFKNASEALKKGTLAAREDDKWLGFGKFIGSTCESMHDNSLIGR